MKILANRLPSGVPIEASTEKPFGTLYGSFFKTK